jgi:hypothetical protein
MRKMMRLFFLWFFLITGNTGFAQYKPYKKGSAFLNWGWNRAAYTNSTLKMKGDDYNLTLEKLAAKDRPTKFASKDYLRYDRITIPQTDLRVGYFLKDNVALVFGVDHMKYVMNQDQVAHVKGEIARNSKYKGTYDQDMAISADFLTFEHTDGLNCLNVGIEVYKDLIKRENSRVKLHWIYGGMLGVMLPKTNVKFLDYERTDRFHVSGGDIEARTAIQALFLKHMIVRIEGDAGYINMPDIILHKSGINGKGKQNFAFAQVNGEIGYHLNF